MTIADFDFKLRTSYSVICAGIALLLVCAGGATPATEEQTKPALPDTSITMPGGQEGTVFKDLVVEGEDLVQIEFERPELQVDLDPQTAPGLQWGSIQQTLDRSQPDLASPLVNFFAYEHFSYQARPWLSLFVANNIARFRPSVTDLDRWQLIVANSRGETVANFKGQGKPPEEIRWNGLSLEGKPTPPGLTCSYVFEAFDRAGNKRSFVGEGFELSPYCVETKEGLVMLFSGRELPSPATSASGGPVTASPILLEVADRINQSEKVLQPVRVEATARSLEKAKALAAGVAEILSPLIIGGEARIQQLTSVETDAMAEGTIKVLVSRF